MEGLERLKNRPDIRFVYKQSATDAEEEIAVQLQLGRCVFSGPEIGVIFTLPHWDPELAKAELYLVVAGLGESGLRNVMGLAEPTIPPMMRAPFSNQVPDFMVVNNHVNERGVGGILAAGFWGNRWEIRADASVMFC